MTDLRKAAEQALEALERLTRGADEDCGEPRCDECKAWRPARAAITALRAALDAQEPTRKAATDDEVYAAALESQWSLEFRDGFRAAERHHGIKEEGET